MKNQYHNDIVITMQTSTKYVTYHYIFLNDCNSWHVEIWFLCSNKRLMVVVLV